MNNVCLVGNLTRDPEVRDGTTTICRFTVAVTDGYGDNEKTSFIPIVVFGKLADNCGQYLTKGSKVGVQGRIQTGSYERDGQKVYTTDIIANRVEFLSSKGNRPDYEGNTHRDEFRASQGYQQMAYDDVPF